MSASKLRVIADRSACCGYGVCVELCPEVYKLDDIGVVSVLMDVVPAELEVRAREAASACPANALRVVEDPA
jgi:ferredoxin